MCSLKGSKCCKEVNGEGTESCWCKLKSDKLKETEHQTKFGGGNGEQKP